MTHKNIMFKNPRDFAADRDDTPSKPWQRREVKRAEPKIGPADMEMVGEKLFLTAVSKSIKVDPDFPQAMTWRELPQESRDYWMAIAGTAKRHYGG